MKRKMMPVIVAAIFFLVIALIAGITALVQHYTPSKERVDLLEYYGLTNTEDTVILLDGHLTQEYCRDIDGHAYLNIDFVQEQLNERFYWDANENILRYTTPTDVISVDAGGRDYYIGKEKNTESYTIVRVDGSEMYLAIDFVQKFTDIEFNLVEEPNRLLITSTWGQVEIATIRKDTRIRTEEGIRNPIVTDVEAGTKVRVLETLEDWSRIYTQDGHLGYVQNKQLEDQEIMVYDREFQAPVFSHNLRDYSINMAWHQVTNADANRQIANVLQSTKGINVISPTWFYLNDNKGNIRSLADSSYVSYCHQNGIEVWGLISNLENPEVDTTAVLTRSSVRDYLTNQIIAAAIEYDLDGINLDFEALEIEVGDSYIQFIRELSLKCENNGIVLSVDNYVPSEYTAFYDRKEQAVFADYIVIMGYDEHYSGSKEGSGASLGFVTKGVEDTLQEVPAAQVILGMPFYTRVWECVPDSSLATDEVTYTVTSSAVGMNEVQRRIEVNGAEKIWLEEEGQYYSEFANEGKVYKIWIEDEASMEPRLQLLKEKGLAGAAFWKLGLEKSSIWDTIIKYVN